MGKSGLLYGVYVSPCGGLLLMAGSDALAVCDWIEGRHGAALRAAMAHSSPGINGIIETAVSELDEYFDGHRRAFDIALAPSGTDFQRAVWRALESIPYGETASYGGVASSIGRARAARAVGAAVGANPISVLVPCHRVIGSRGAITGYAGGTEAKRFLLSLEGASFSFS